MPNSLAVEIFTVAVLADAPLFSVTLTVTTLPLTDVLHHVSVDDAETALSFVVAVMVFPVLSAALLKFREDGATVSLLFCQESDIVIGSIIRSSILNFNGAA